MEQMEQEQKLGDYTITFTKDRAGNKATFYIRDIDVATYKAVKALVAQGKMIDAVELMAKELWVGGDPVSLIKGNFVALMSLQEPLVSLIEPMESEIKKN